MKNNKTKRMGTARTDTARTGTAQTGTARRNSEGRDTEGRDTERPATNDSGRRQFIRSAAVATFAFAVPIRFNRAGSALSFAPDDFFGACARGDIDEVRRLVNADPRLLNATDKTGLTGYAVSLLNNRPGVAALLQESGYVSDAHEAALALDWDRFEAAVDTRPSCVDEDHPIGGTTMYAAATGGAGADIWHMYAGLATPNANPRGRAGATALQIALKYRDLAVAELTAAAILSNSGNPNPAPNALPPPLHLAAERGSTELAEMLIQFGADVAAIDAHGRTAKDVATRSNHAGTARLLENHQAIPRISWSARTALDVYGRPYRMPAMETVSVPTQANMVGISHRQVDGVRELLATERRLAHSIATTGERAVEAGAHMGNPEVVSLLLEAGAPYSLATAAMRNDLSHARTLLKRDPASVNERGAHGFALLWYPVIGGGHLEMLQLLLDQGASIEDHHFLGTTALHFACRGRQAETVEFLIENGADVNRRGRKFGATPVSPLEMATKAGDQRIVSLLKARGARN